MAKIYAAPESVPVPEFDPDATMEQWDAADAAYIEAVRRLAPKGTGKNADLVGAVVGFGVADGSAQYMVWRTSPLELVHLPLGDAYQIPAAHARGLRLSDIRQMVERERWWAAAVASQK
jgi:hypothetical protein